MTQLQDLADVIRSKNAGPFQITIDLMFNDLSSYRRVLESHVLTAENIAQIYQLQAGDIAIIPFERVRAIKITMPRKWGSNGSGSAFDRDVYGAQQHGPMAGLEIP